MEIELSSGGLAELAPTVGAKRGLVISPDDRGCRMLFADMASRLALMNDWNVIVVDPFRGRQPPAGDPEAQAVVIGELDDDEVVGDLVEAADRLEVDPVAVLGFGLGGMYALKAAASHRFDRVASVYGPVVLPEQWRGPGQREPLRLIEHAANPASILACHGRCDELVKGEDVEQLAAVGAEVVWYDEVGHGFAHDPSNSAYQPEAAADVWKRLVGHLGMHPAQRGSGPSS